MLVLMSLNHPVMTYTLMLMLTVHVAESSSDDVHSYAYANCMTLVRTRLKFYIPEIIVYI